MATRTPRTGRPRGSANMHAIPKKKLKVKSSAELLKIATDGEILPIAVLMEAMRHYYGKWKENKEENIKDLREAAAFAKEAAPYFHPKLASTEIKGDPTKPLTPPNVQIFFGEPDDPRFNDPNGIQAVVPS